MLQWGGTLLGLITKSNCNDDSQPCRQLPSHTPFTVNLFSGDTLLAQDVENNSAELQQRRFALPSFRRQQNRRFEAQNAVIGQQF